VENKFSDFMKNGTKTFPQGIQVDTLVLVFSSFRQLSSEVKEKIEKGSYAKKHILVLSKEQLGNLYSPSLSKIPQQIWKEYIPKEEKND